MVLDLFVRKVFSWHWWKILFLSFVVCGSGYAQGEVSGRVFDANGEPLPFVNILVNQDGHRGTTTDIDGRFTLSLEKGLNVLQISSIGYQDVELSLDTVDLTVTLHIVMQPQAYDFTTVEVVAGVNPADVIMRRVIRNRHRNDPQGLESYRCETYNKVVMSWLPREADYRSRLESRVKEGDTLKLNQRQRRMLDMMQTTDRHHLFLMESLTEKLYRHPAAYAETILASRVSGFREAPFTALANDVQPFSFYDEQVMLLDKAFLNPVSPGSPERYFFQMEDTLYRQQDTVYLIAFHPRKHKNFNGLKGVLYINTHRYGVQNIIAEPADTGLLHFRIEQLYDRPDSLHWFPSQLNYEIRMPKYPDPHLGIQIRGKSYIREAAINVPLPADPFQHADRYTFADTAYLLPDSAWSYQRPQPLDTLEQRTYELVDSLGDSHNFDGWMERLERLGRGRWPLGMVDISLSHLVQFNQFEDLRLGLGLYSSEKLSSWFTLGGYAGFGFRDEEWKYGADLSFFPDWQKAWELQLYCRKDIREAGAFRFPLEDGLITRRLFADRMDREKRYGAFFRGMPVRNLQLGIEVAHTTLTPLFDYAFQPEGETAPDREFQFSEAAVHLQYAYGQHYRRILGQRVPDGNERPYPTVSFSLTRGMGPAWKGAYPYWKTWAAVDQSFRILRLGKLTYRLEGALVSGDVPLSRLFSSSGVGREFQWLTVGDIFQTMDPYEFLSDRYFSFFLRQDFGTLLFRTKWLQPSISLEHHFIIGNLSHPERHRGIDFKTLEKGYAEAGLVIDNLLRLNYLNFAYLGFGGGLYYRYGAYHLPGGVGENLAFRFSLAFDF